MARSDFGVTWWGRAWVAALENAGSGYDSRLPRGRTYARKGAVLDLEVLPGHISARVVGTTGELYRVDIAVRKLAPDEWEQVAEAVASRAAHLAALLDGELHPGIVDDAEAVEVRILPTASDLRPDCSCPDWAEPCKHAAAVCYIVAAELDRDPFTLFLARGIEREELISLVRSRRAASSGAAVQDAEQDVPEGVLATDAWLGHRLDEPLPELPDELLAARSGTLARGPGHRAAWDVDLPPNQGIDPRRIDELAEDAVLRAWAMIVDGATSGLLVAPRADLARRAAGAVSRAELSDLADLAGITAARLQTWAEAWSVAGSAGVAAVADADGWSTNQEVLAHGRDLLVELGVPRRSIALNYDSLRMADNVWLVVGQDGRWFRLHGSGKHQDLRLVQPPSDDVRDLLDL